MSIFSRKSNDTPTTTPAVEVSASPVAPYEVGQIVLIEGRYHTLEPARVLDKVAGQWESVFIVQTAAGRLQVGSHNIYTTRPLQVALDMASAFGGDIAISLDDPDK